jgi:hypothetical protein
MEMDRRDECLSIVKNMDIGKIAVSKNIYTTIDNIEDALPANVRDPRTKKDVINYICTILNITYPKSRSITHYEKILKKTALKKTHCEEQELKVQKEIDDEIKRVADINSGMSSTCAGHH